MSPQPARMDLSRKAADKRIGNHFVPLGESGWRQDRPATMREANILLAAAEKTIGTLSQRIEELENLALTDELTGLLNRRGLLALLRQELAAAARDPKAAGILVMVDLNGFKSINDTHGHSAGDAYLQAVAAALVSTVRPSDTVARLGGDEFAILLTRIDSESGQHRLQHIDHAFHTRSLTWGGHVLPLRASFGAAAWGRDSLPESVLTEADTRLYAQKAARK